ncbi:MBL fold metallo-hydrolase [Streptomyces himalayensis]|uniref:MBL fold metallo-hydrolase n=1 Tax=Streptomyces himalayensis subsp. himalayensis TaxID=2756131 RepID=A0A7W0IBA6_9ACTN|nr:MBL fold metallo-hydrolase [Streptomyces himalayensis]MBA2949188.1 MBL fold metallo-hydrolase [Streptomyces himalayensis subsp. himalayensis]
MDVAWGTQGWEKLSPRVGRRRLPVWDCTVGLVVGEGAALMVDAGSSLREGAELRREAQQLLGGDDRRVTHLALTHPHFDHVLGAAAFAGVEVYGPVGLDWVFAAGRKDLLADAVRHGLDPADAAEAADLLVAPRHRVSGEWTLDLGGGHQVLLANVGPGHTGHDMAVLVPATATTPEIVFCGDLVEESGEPQAGPDAVPSHWPAALDRLLSLGGEDAVYVPGHGAAVNAAFVRAQRDQLAARFGVS